MKTITLNISQRGIKFFIVGLLLSFITLLAIHIYANHSYYIGNRYDKYSLLYKLHPNETEIKSYKLICFFRKEHTIRKEDLDYLDDELVRKKYNWNTIYFYTRSAIIEHIVLFVSLTIIFSFCFYFLSGFKVKVNYVKKTD